MLEISETYKDDIVVLRLKDDGCQDKNQLFDLDHGKATHLQKFIKKLKGEGHGKIIIDMSNIKLFDVSAMAPLASIAQELKVLKIFINKPLLCEAIKVTKTERLFIIYPSEDEAVESFRV